MRRSGQAKEVTRCSSWRSWACSTRPRCTATSCASSSARGLGGLRVISYGSLYPALRRLTRAGLIVEDTAAPDGSWSRRARRVYRITAEGKERFAELLADSGPQSFDDDGFGVHLAFFSRTPAEIRMRILEGRRRAVEERREGLRGRAGPRRGADRPLHPRAAPARPRRQRARGAVAQRVDPAGAGGTGSRRNPANRKHANPDRGNRENNE